MQQWLVRVQNWLFRQILIFPLRVALLVVGILVLAGWGMIEHGHAFTKLYIILAVLALANLAFAIAKRRRRFR